MLDYSSIALQAMVVYLAVAGPRAEKIARWRSRFYC